MIVQFFILLIGLIVYAGYGWTGLVYICGTTVVSYLVGRLIPRHRWLMAASVLLQALILLTVKLLPVMNMSVVVPLGISYFTLQIISYHVDIYRGKYKPERNLLRYSLFITYLPHIFVGPIECYDQMVPALFENRRVNWNEISQGCMRFIWGLFKKLVIAARAGMVVGTISANPDQFQGAYALLAMVLYSLQLYTDFSGAIDMVLGVSQVFGVDMSENFDSPYSSQSIKEFWRRWHMTLGSWLREYVYIPLGGNRKGERKKVFNLVITFMVSGLWHGIHYLLWGLLNGLFVACGDWFKTRWKFLNQIGTFLLVTLLWCFFVWPDTMTAVKMLVSVFTTYNYGQLAMNVGILGLTVGDWIVLLMSAAALGVCDTLRVRFKQRFMAMGPAGRIVMVGTMALVVLVFGMYGIGFNAEAFIYSRF